MSSCAFCEWLRKHGYLKPSALSPPACFVRTDYDLLTNRVSAYLGVAVENARALGFTVYDLYGGEAVQNVFLNVLHRFSPVVVCVGTHGLRDRLIGQDGKPLLESCVNDDVLAGKTVFALACQSASGLGYSAVGKGCLAYFGWLEDWIIIMDESLPPLQDPYAYSFFRPVLDGINVLLNDVLRGVDVQTLALNVYEAVVKGYNEEIDYWKRVPTPTASEMVTYLIHDRDYFVPITATGIYTPPSAVTFQLPLKQLATIGIIALPLAIKSLKA
ncbi:MAG: hypothetical protein QXO67_00405 [Candidatus Bathyarchaeia archaeon]